MPQMTRYATGAPCWADMATPDLDGAARFYADLFGWRANPVPGSDGNYRTMTLDDRAVCAVYAMSAARAEAGEQPAWLVYLNVPDVAAAAERAVTLGGTLRAPVYQVPNVGSMALIQDPSGGIVALWEAGPMVGADVWGDAGALSWTELTTRDREAAVVFFAQLLGLRPENVPGSGSYTVLHGADGPAFGVLEMDDHWPDAVPPHWMSYFSVIDTDDAVRHITDLGGAVQVAPFDTPFGRIAVATDPHDGYFSVVGPVDEAAAAAGGE